MSDVANQKQHILSAARRLADRQRPAFDAAALAAEARLPLPVIARHYADLGQLQCELLGRMYDEICELVAKLTLNMPAGAARLRLTLEACLQALLERPGLRALTRELRLHPQGALVIRQRVRGFRLMLELELQGARWANPAVAAQLCTAALIETSNAESEAGQPLPALRETLIGYFTTAGAA